MSTKRSALGSLFLFAALLGGYAHAQDAVPNQPQTCYVIPIKGVIGKHFTAGRMQTHLNEATELKPAVVVLELDTAGGDIADAERIVDFIIAHKHLRVIAFVRKALSAGATIALACEKIFVTESATIGGAVSYSVGTDGVPRSLPADIAEKFQSAWRAVCRKAAEHGGHPSLLAEAMVDPAFALTMREEAGKPLFERDGHGKVLKAKGRILTLTAREAVDCRLAQAMVPDLQAAGQHLGMPGWHGLGAEARGQVPATTTAAKTQLDAITTPSALYDVLCKKVVSLGLTRQMTQLQKNKALDEWKAWLDAQRLSGRRVQWAVTLVEALEGEARLVPVAVKASTGPAGLLQGSSRFRNLITKTSDGQSRCTTAILAGSLKAKGMTAQQLRDLLASIRTGLEELQRGRLSASYREYLGGSVREWQQGFLYFSWLCGESEAYPVKVIVKDHAEPRVFHIVAWLSVRSRDALARVWPQSEIVLSGKIGEVIPFLSDDGVFLIEVILDECELVADPGA